MKLLLDQHLSIRLLDGLENHYPESEHVRHLGMDQASDKAIWEYAKEHGFTIATKDSDFYEYSALYGAPPKVIWLKCGNSPRQLILDILNNNHQLISKFIHNDDDYCLQLYR